MPRLQQSQRSVASGRSLIRADSSTLVFNGTTSNVNLGATMGGFEYNTPFSVSVWLCCGSYSDQEIIGKRRNTTTFRGWAVTAIGSSGQIQVLLRNSATLSASVVTQAGSYRIGNWFHLLTTYDGTDANGIRIYINGVSQTLTVTDNDLATNTIASGTNAYIGCRNGADIFFLGQISELAVYNRALTSGEALVAYQTGTLPTDNIHAVWSMTEGTGTSLADSGASQYTGTITSATWGTKGPKSRRSAVSTRSAV